MLKELDLEIELSEGHRADMLLDLAGLDRGERIMIQASIANARDFDKIADALVVQHPRIHMREVRTGAPSGRFVKGKGKRKGGKGKRKGKRKSGGKNSFSYSARLTTDDGDWTYEEDGD